MPLDLTINAFGYGTGGGTVTQETVPADGVTVYAPKENVVVLVRNDGGAKILVIQPVPTDAVRPGDAAWPPQTVPDLTLNIDSGASGVVGPIPSAYLGATGRFTIQVDASDDLFMAAYRMPS